MNMYRQRQKVPNLSPAKLVITNQLLSVHSFKTAGTRRKALATLTRKEYPKTPIDLTALVKAGKVAEGLVVPLKIRLAGMSRKRQPKNDGAPPKPFSFKLGAPFITTTDGPSTLAQIANAHPRGFRDPSKKAKNWKSRSLVEKVMKIESVFEPSKRGIEKAHDERLYRALAKATQNVRNIPSRYLTRSQKTLRKLSPGLPRAQTIAGIKEAFALEKLATGSPGPSGPQAKAAA